MRVEIRSDSVVIDGYVNVVERESKPMKTSAVTKEGNVIVRFIEKIKQGAFAKSLQRRSAVSVLLNHQTSRVLASTTDGTAVLKEDPVGLYCRAIIYDEEVINKAHEGKLNGWSFGFRALNAKRTVADANSGIEMRDIYELDLQEVSILDDTKNPAYPANSISLRDDTGEEIEIRTIEDVTVVDKTAENKATETEVSNPDNKGEDIDGGNESPASNYLFHNRVLKARAK